MMITWVEQQQQQQPPRNKRSSSLSISQRSLLVLVAVGMVALLGLFQSSQLTEQSFQKAYDAFYQSNQPPSINTTRDGTVLVRSGGGGGGIVNNNTTATVRVSASLTSIDVNDDNETPNMNIAASGPVFTNGLYHSPRDYVLPYPQDSLRLTSQLPDIANLSSSSSSTKIIHVLSHTHWDREWYLSLEEFRGSLVMEMDRVLRMLSNSSETKFHHFHLDGQFLMVEDYLQVRPQMRQVIIRLNQRGKVTLGPFYSQPDVFLSSGEALIRNLMLGMSLSSYMGGTSTVGYLADTFGFMGQMPQLLRGCGIHSFVSGRFRKTGATEGYWIGPDGSRVLFAYLGKWYCHLVGLFKGITTTTLTKRQAKSLVERIDADLTGAGSKSKHRLAMHGCDHYMTDPNIGEKLELMNEVAATTITTTTPDGDTNANTPRIQVVQTNIDDYMHLLEKDIANIQDELPTVVGEVRDGVDSLINSASTKMSVKQQNFKLQALLEKWMEPMEAYGWALSNGRRFYDSDQLYHVWKPILQTHAHDSICSTSASSVIHDIVNRLARSEQSAHRVIADQASQVVPEMVRQLTRGGHGGQVLVTNPTNTIRHECMVFTVVSSARSAGTYKGYRDLLLLGSDDRIRPVIAMETRRSQQTYELPHSQFRKATYKTSVTYLAQISLPPNGLALLELVEQDPTQTTSGPLLVESTSNDGTAPMENRYLSVAINESDGSCTLTHLESGRSWSSVNKLWRTREAGTTYKHVARGSPANVSDLRIVSQKSSPLFSSIRLEGTLGTSSISITYILFANAKGVEIETTIDNGERGNYVAASFPIHRSSVDSKETVQVDVDGNFEYVDRSKMTNRYVHQNRFTSLYSNGASLTIANRGIPEYVVDNANMHMTLLRGVDKIGDWIAGPLADDISQELGKMTFQYAVIPDTCRVAESSCTADLEARNFVDPIGSFANWVVDGYRPERYLDLDVSPLSVVSALSIDLASEGEKTELDESITTMGTTQLFNLKPEKLILSAVKKAESKDALVVRVYNPISESLQATISPGIIKFNEVRHVMLNENEYAENDEDTPLQIQGHEENGEFHFEIRPYKIVTLLLFDNK